MLKKLRSDNALYQQDTVWEIQQQFGNDFSYENDNGNLAISREVLSAFRKLTGDTVVWSRGERYWRFREDYEDPKRQ